MKIKGQTVAERGTNMKRTHLIAALVGLVAIGIFATDAAAYYHPGLGRFTSRDPGAGGAMRIGGGGPAVAGGFIPRDPTGSNQYADGMNLYQYVRSNPIDGLDPMGLWKINRNGGAKATAIAERDDTIEKLAKQVGLNASEWQSWATPHGPILGRSITWARLKTTEKLCGSEVVEVPNTVFAYWAGEVGGFGKWWVMWERDVDTLKSRGFNVSVQQGLTAVKFQQYIQNTTKSKDLHGIFFWGHGIYEERIVKPAPDWDKLKVFEKKEKVYVGIGTDSDQKTGEYQSMYAMWKPEYKMGLGILFACGTQAGRDQFSDNAIFWGKEGVLVPHGAHIFGPTVDSLIPKGAQGTK